jgi:hypothetical protein
MHVKVAENEARTMEVREEIRNLASRQQKTVERLPKIRTKEPT